jgi:hypothetical protein
VHIVLLHLQPITIFYIGLYSFVYQISLVFRI